MIFTQVMKPIAFMAHKEGIRLHQYIDDWLCVGRSQEEAFLHTKRLLQTAVMLGLRVNEEKSELIPSTSSTYLGMVFDSIKFRAFLTQKRIDNLLQPTSHFLLQDYLPVWKWLQLLGHLASLEKLVKNGRRRLRPLQFQLKENWRHPQTKNHYICIVSDSGSMVVPATDSKKAYRWNHSLQTSRYIRTRPKRAGEHV